VGLGVPGVHPATEDVVLMDASGGTAAPVPPVGDGPLVEAEGGDDRLQRAAVAEQGQHDGHQVGRLLEAEEWGIAGLGEGAVAGGAAVAPLRAAMHADVAEPEVPACGAGGVVAG